MYALDLSNLKERRRLKAGREIDYTPLRRKKTREEI